MHIERTGTLVLPIAPDEALPHFSPEGERRWVAGWEPVALHAPDGTLARAGAAFTTAVGGEATLWLVLEFDRARRTASYARITPGSRLGTVRVTCRDDSHGGTVVEVTYALTSISSDGEQKLAALTADSYRAMLDDWREKIGSIL